MQLLQTEWKRKFSMSFYKNLKLKLFEMSLDKDFVTEVGGDLYPIADRSEDCTEFVEDGRYQVSSGRVQRVIGQFFPYATYELTADTADGTAGVSFRLPECTASLRVQKDTLSYTCRDSSQAIVLPTDTESIHTLIVSCRPGAFDVYVGRNGRVSFLHTFSEPRFRCSDRYDVFTAGKVLLFASGCVTIQRVCAYMDNGIAVADLRPIRYENGDVMYEHGRVYFTASVRMQVGAFQGIFSWIPGTAEFAMSGALFYDSGDGRWCGDVAASILYHRSAKQWYLWVCSFAHGHRLGHAAFDGDPRFGVNVVDIELMDAVSGETAITSFSALEGDEDPDFFYDEANDRWLMAICRVDPTIQAYRYVFFESERPFEGYRFLGQGVDGAETGGSFVRVDGELFFLCGNDFHAVSDYRIYHKDGMTRATFDYPDGGFRGWGTMLPIKMGSRVRSFWVTFDRHTGSDFRWSYGDLYCFEAP